MLTEELGLLLWRTARACSRQDRDAIADLGLTSRQASALRIVVHNPGISLSGLADALVSDQSTASAVVDRLMSEGLVRRETDMHDRRRASFYATEGALEIATRLTHARHQSEATLVNVLGEERCEVLRELLSQLCEELDRGSNMVEGKEKRH
jgi:DNA-binding MarR family transcriptional regulator